MEPLDKMYNLLLLTATVGEEWQVASMTHSWEPLQRRFWKQKSLSLISKFDKVMASI